MALEDDIDLSTGGRRSSGLGALLAGGTGLLRTITILGFAVMTIALIAVPLLDSSDETYVAQAFSGQYGDAVDRTVTGSVARGGTYTIRRSVLQPSADAVCIIMANGTRSGAC